MRVMSCNAMTELTIDGPSRTTRRRGRRPGTSAPTLLRHLAGWTTRGADGTLTDALRRVWSDGFCASAASIAPVRVWRCAECGEPFAAGDRRAIYGGARCRNTAVTRRYGRRLHARRGAPRGES